MQKENKLDFYRDLPLLESKDKPFTRTERLMAIEEPLLAWFYKNARILPWRENPSPYRVWISEIMLQQTRVEAVKPYFERFINALPDLTALAAVEEDLLMKLWEGLGYYNRARNLKKTAQLLIESGASELPDSYEELLALPGIGPYTAGAIASIAYGIAVPAVDGNVLRVISRVLASSDDILKQSVKSGMEKELLAIMPKTEAGDYNQALMELGAIVCVPNGSAKCQVCPLSSLCLAKQKGLTDVLPVKTKKAPRRIEQKTVLVIEDGQSVAIRKRAKKGLLSGLYEFPNVPDHLFIEDIDKIMENMGILEIKVMPLPTAKHIFSHVEWHMIGYRVRVKEGDFPTETIAVSKADLNQSYAIPTAFSKYLSELMETTFLDS